jgi:predicted transcriptional regulator
MSQAYFEAANRRRSRLEVKISILKAVDEGASRQAQIMYHCNLSWSFARTFIKILERQGLISTIVMNGKKNFTITERGKRALFAYTAVTKELELESLRENNNNEYEKRAVSEIEVPRIIDD